MTTIDTNQRAELGIDGNCGFALIGENLQEGEAEFVQIPPVTYEDVPDSHHERYTGECRKAQEMNNKLWAAKEAHRRLRLRLGCADKLHLYYFGPSHPYGCD